MYWRHILANGTCSLYERNVTHQTETVGWQLQGSYLTSDNAFLPNPIETPHKHCQLHISRGYSTNVEVRIIESHEASPVLPYLHSHYGYWMVSLGRSSSFLRQLDMYKPLFCSFQQDWAGEKTTNIFRRPRFSFGSCRQRCQQLLETNREEH